MSAILREIFIKILYNHRCRKELVMNMLKNEHSLYRLMNIYMNDSLAGIRFFYNIKWPEGYHCEECGSSHYIYDQESRCFICSKCGHKEDLLAHTVFSECLDNPNSLILGLYLCLTSKRRVSQKELAQLVTIPVKSAAILIKNTKMIDECNIREDIIKKMFENSESHLLKNVSYTKNNQSNRAIIPTKAG